MTALTPRGFRAALCLCALLLAYAADEARAQSGASAGEELYNDYFGCLNCHGPAGRGGDGQPLRETYLPLSLFIKTLRLPAGEMPPFSDILATDSELAIVYEWLEGVDVVAVPPPVTITVEASEEPRAGVEAEVSFTARPADGGPEGQEGQIDSDRFRYRLTVL